MTTDIELLANGVTAASILLAGRNSVHTWWVGIVGCVAFGLVFYAARLYADVALQIFFVATSLIGWWQWVRGDQGKALVVSHAGSGLLGQAVVIGMVTTLGYGAILDHYTDAYAPFLDSAIMAFSVIAQIFLMNRRIETWLFWLIVNSIAVPLYASRELYLTAFLYGAYWVNAVVSWRRWRGLVQPMAHG